MGVICIVKPPSLAVIQAPAQAIVTTIGNLVLGGRRDLSRTMQLLLRLDVPTSHCQGSPTILTCDMWLKWLPCSGAFLVAGRHVMLPLFLCKMTQSDLT